MRKSGYKDYEIQLDIVAQDSVSLESLMLSRLDVPLKIMTQPESASININDEYRGLTPMEIMLEPLVEHKILISKPGYKDINNQLRLDTIESLSSKGKNSEVLDYFLEEILGQVSFVGTDGAKVYRSDDLIGVIPFNIEMISEEQTLQVKYKAILLFHLRNL